MRTALVGPEIEENLGLRYLAAALGKAGHDCAVVAFDDGRQMERVARRVMRQRPQLVGLALVAQRRFEDVRALTGALRRRGYRGHITAGGHFASLRADEVLRDTPGLDTILHHDAEERIVALAGWIASREQGEPPRGLDGITWRTGSELRHRPPLRVAPIDTLPLPQRKRPGRLLGHGVAPIISSRGCTGSCSFCSIHAWHRQVPSGRLRLRAPERVAAEMAALRRDKGVRVFVFHDDDFVQPGERRALERCRAIFENAEAAIGEPIAFVVKVRPDHVSEALFRYLKQRGLVRAYVGIETHSAAGIAALNRRATPETNERALAILRALDVNACFNLLLLHPDSTAADLRENLAFLERNLDVPFDVARTELYARSTLEDRVLREGRAIGDYRGFDYTVEDPVAEAWFRLFASLLWQRQFGKDPILQRVQGLRLRLALLERFHPGMATPDLRSRVLDLVRATNQDTVGYLRRCLDLASAGPSAPSELECRRMREEIRSRTRAQHARAASLSLELEARAALARAGRGLLWPSAGLLGRASRAVSSLAVAAGALFAPGCGGPGYADPPPPPPSPCARTLALSSGGPVPVGGYLALPFHTERRGRLEVTVNQTFASSALFMVLVPGSCTVSEVSSGSCTQLATFSSAGKLTTYSTAPLELDAGSYQLFVVNPGTAGESVAVQVVVSDATCPPPAIPSK